MSTLNALTVAVEVASRKRDEARPDPSRMAIRPEPSK